MKLSLISVLAMLAAGLANASTIGPIPDLAQLPEPSAAAMLVLGAFAVVIGLSGKRRQS